MNKKFKYIVSIVVSVSCLMTWTVLPAFSAAESVTKPLGEGIKYSIDKVAGWATEAALKELQGRWLASKTTWLIDVSDAGVFKQLFENTGTIVNVLQVGECVYAGDYKAAAEISLLTAVAVAIPVAGQVIALGKIYVEFIRGLDAEIYNINKKTVYKIFQKDEKIWDRATGVDRFIDQYVMKDSTLRAFLYEYAERDLGRAPTRGLEWFSSKKWWEDRLKVRLIVASLRFEFRPIHEKEKKLEELKKVTEVSIKELQKFMSFLDSNKDWVEARAREIQEKTERTSFVNSKLNEQAQKIIREAQSSIPDQPSSKKNFSHLEGAAYDAARKRVNAILDSNSLQQEEFYKIGTHLPDILKGAIVSGDPEIKSLSRASSYNLNNRFAVRYMHDFSSDKKYLIGMFRNLATRNYIPADFIRSLRYRPVPIDDIENRISTYREKYSKQLEELETLISAIESEFKSQASKEQRIIDSQKELVNNIKYTGYEDYDRSIRRNRMSMDKVVIQKNVSLERDRKIWDEIVGDAVPVQESINKALESLEQVSSLISEIRSVLSTLKQSNKTAAEFQEKWKKEKMTSLETYNDNIVRFQEMLDQVENDWAKVFAAVGSRNYYPRDKKIDTVKKIVKTNSRNSSVLIENINKLYHDKYYSSDNNKKLKNILTKNVYIEKRRQLTPREYFSFDRIHYPHVEDYMDMAERANGMRRRELFEERIESVRESVQETQSGLRDLKSDAADVTTEIERLLRMIDYFDDLVMIKNTIRRVQSKQLLIQAELAAFDQGMENYKKSYKDMLGRIQKEKQDELKRQQEADSMIAEEKKAQEEFRRFRAELTDIGYLYWELKRMKRYFDAAIAQQQSGFAQTLYLSMKERVTKISGIHDDAKEQYLAITSTKYMDEARKAMANVIDMKVSADLILETAENALSPLVRDMNILQEDLMTLLDDQDIEDVISGRTDSDGDGVSDRDELQLGSDPTDSSDTPYDDDDEEEEDEDPQIVISGIATLSDMQSFDFSTGQVIGAVDDDVTFYDGGGAPFVESFGLTGVGSKDMPGDFNTAPEETGGVYSGGFNPIAVGDYLAVYTGNVENKYAKFYIQSYSSPNITIRWWYISDGSRSFNQ